VISAPGGPVDDGGPPPPNPPPTVPAPDLRERLLAVASLGVQRKPGPDRPWASGQAAELGLQAAAAALAAEGGPALAQRLDALAPLEGLDAGAAFARALALGTAAGEVAAEAAARTLRGVRPEARPACVDALSLAPGPAVGPALARILDDAPPALLSATLEVLRFRRQCPYARAVIFLAHPSPAVVAAAARALGARPHTGGGGPPTPQQRAAAAVLGHVLSAGPVAEVALAAAETLLALGDPAGLAFVRDRLEAESAAPSLPDEVRVGYLRLLGLAGDARDRELFFRSVEPGPADAAAVGWFGHPDLVEWLLGSLETANDARRSKGGAPSPFESAAARALYRIVGHPTSPPGSPEPPPVDATAWRAAWARVRAQVPPRLKLRLGKPYTPGATLDELEAEALSGATRADAALELSIVTRGAAGVEPGDWIARQRAAIAAARATPARDTSPAGTFAGARLGER
jgi:hypothetical protein